MACLSCRGVCIGISLTSRCLPIGVRRGRVLLLFPLSGIYFFIRSGLFFFFFEISLCLDGVSVL